MYDVLNQFSLRLVKRAMYFVQIIEFVGIILFLLMMHQVLFEGNIC